MNEGIIANAEGQYENFTGMILYGGTEAYVENASFLLESHRFSGNIINWYDGTWIDGTASGMCWVKGEWMNGVWKNGLWWNGTWHNGTWEYGQFLGGIWMDGWFKKGIFQSKRWLGGRFEGVFRDVKTNKDSRMIPEWNGCDDDNTKCKEAFSSMWVESLLKAGIRKALLDDGDLMIQSDRT